LVWVGVTVGVPNTGVNVGEMLDVEDGDWVDEGDGEAVNVDVGLFVGVGLELDVGVGVGLAVEVRDGVGVNDAVMVGLDPKVTEGVPVGEIVGVDVLGVVMKAMSSMYRTPLFKAPNCPPGSLKITSWMDCKFGVAPATTQGPGAGVLPGLQVAL
jgi:hypothetical protein